MKNKIEKVKEIMSKFVQDELELYKARYTETIDDSAFDKMHGKFLELFLKQFVDYKLTQYNRTGNDLSNPRRVEQFKSTAIPRDINLILKYENPKLGEQLDRLLQTNSYYRVVLGANKTYQKGIMKEAFDICELNQEFKIFSRNSFENGEWKCTHRLTEFQILKDGDLVEVLKVTPPEDEEHLAYYKSLNG